MVTLNFDATNVPPLLYRSSCIPVRRKLLTAIKSMGVILSDLSDNHADLSDVQKHIHSAQADLWSALDLFEMEAGIND